jgi:hypothetical protein
MVRATQLRWREASTAVPQARMAFQIGAGKGAWADIRAKREDEVGSRGWRAEESEGGEEWKWSGDGMKEFFFNR